MLVSGEEGESKKQIGPICNGAPAQKNGGRSDGFGLGLLPIRRDSKLGLNTHSHLRGRKRSRPIKRREGKLKFRLLFLGGPSGRKSLLGLAKGVFFLEDSICFLLSLLSSVVSSLENLPRSKKTLGKKERGGREGQVGIPAIIPLRGLGQSAAYSSSFFVPQSLLPLLPLLLVSAYFC